MKNIALVDFDGKIPNLALMKLSTYHKELGNKVYLVRKNSNLYEFDKVYISTIFSKSKNEVKKVIDYYKNIDIEFGGTGFDINTKLPEEIENLNPDYDLYYPGFLKINGVMKKESRIKKEKEILDSGIGFLTRGCVRNCGFCVVPRKEGKIHDVNCIENLINPRSNKIILLDNNITADPKVYQKLKRIKDLGIVIDITQGIDVRIINHDIAKLLSEVKHMRSIHFAWDRIQDENNVLKGLNIIKKYIKPYKLMCFILAGFNTTFEEDLYRVKTITANGVNPYLMVYQNPDKEKTYHSKMLRHFSRWVNARIYKVTDFNNYEPYKKLIKQTELFI